jgi:hypothetical protein
MVSRLTLPTTLPWTLAKMVVMIIVKMALHPLGACALECSGLLERPGTRSTQLEVGAAFEVYVRGESHRQKYYSVGIATRIQASLYLGAVTGGRLALAPVQRVGGVGGWPAAVRNWTYVETRCNLQTHIMLM